MNDPQSPRDRYAARARELHVSSAEGLGPERVLGAAGDLLRRSAALGVDHGAVDAALLALSPEAVAAWSVALPERVSHAHFERAAHAAAAVALAESPEERAPALHAALDALHALDGLASVAVALARRVELGAEDDPALHHALVQQLDGLDRAAAARARWLVGLNDHRRKERDLLDPGPRERAFWYSARAGCDGLLAALAGEPAQGGAWDTHLRGCAACAADLAATRLVDAPPTPHLTEAELLRFELGELSPRERARVERHADACFDCGQAVWALADGERAIVESASPDHAAH